MAGALRWPLPRPREEAEAAALADRAEVEGVYPPGEEQQDKGAGGDSDGTAADECGAWGSDARDQGQTEENAAQESAEMGHVIDLDGGLKDE